MPSKMWNTALPTFQHSIVFSATSNSDATCWLQLRSIFVKAVQENLLVLPLATVLCVVWGRCVGASKIVKLDSAPQWCWNRCAETLLSPLVLSCIVAGNDAILYYMLYYIIYCIELVSLLSIFWSISFWFSYENHRVGSRKYKILNFLTFWCYQINLISQEGFTSKRRTPSVYIHSRQKMCFFLVI